MRLQVLFLRANRITDAVVNEIAGAMGENKTLKALDLSYNLLTKKGL